MSKMPSLLQGAIALEYGEIATTLRAIKITDPTCGDTCTNPVDGPKGHEAGSCPLIPGGEKKEKQDKKDKKDKKDKYAFVPIVAGWSEPPANRV